MPEMLLQLWVGWDFKDRAEEEEVMGRGAQQFLTLPRPTLQPCFSSVVVQISFHWGLTVQSSRMDWIPVPKTFLCEVLGRLFLVSTEQNLLLTLSLQQVAPLWIREALSKPSWIQAFLCVHLGIAVNKCNSSLFAVFVLWFCFVYLL